MTAALVILAALAAVGFICYIHYRLTDSEEAALPETQTAVAEEEECCGMHITCERDSLLAAVSKEIEYYDDEELDAYRGREAHDYTGEEIEQFRDVLLTLLPDDIAGWARSLQLRGITLPAEVRDELLLIVSETRQMRSATVSR